MKYITVVVFHFEVFVCIVSSVLSLASLCAVVSVMVCVVVCSSCFCVSLVCVCLST